MHYKPQNLYKLASDNADTPRIFIKHKTARGWCLFEEIKHIVGPFWKTIKTDLHGNRRFWDTPIKYTRL